METYEQINVSTPIPIIANEKSRRPNRLRIHCGHAGVVLSRLTGLRKTTCYGTAPGHRETLGTPDHHHPGAARYQKTVWLPFVANFRISPGATAFSSAKASDACAVMLARTPWGVGAALDSDDARLGRLQPAPASKTSSTAEPIERNPAMFISPFS